MTKHRARNVWRLAGGALVAGLATMALWPSTYEVVVETAAYRPLAVTIEEEGRTRVRERFVVTAPVAGRLLRIATEPGDRVRQGDVIARLQPAAPPLLDVRAQAEARAAVDAATAAVGQARATLQRTQAALAQAERELTRARQLNAAGALSAQALEARDQETRDARNAAEVADFAVRAAASELERARAAAGRSGATTTAVVAIRAPVDGVILKRHHESETVVPAGEPLFEIGDPRQLEVVVDLLSSDVSLVSAGARAIVSTPGATAPLAARVRLVEPSGFTKVSALGVEEQRVNVVLAFADPEEACQRLGDAYRVDVAIVTWEAARVLTVPTSALFRDGQRQAVFAVRDGRAERVFVHVGQRSAAHAEVRSGLAEGTPVILHPTDVIVDGVPVRAAQPEAR
jgi:HlyD family secretion protein